MEFIKRMEPLSPAVHNTVALKIGLSEGRNYDVKITRFEISIMSSF